MGMVPLQCRPKVLRPPAHQHGQNTPLLHKSWCIAMMSVLNQPSPPAVRRPSEARPRTHHFMATIHYSPGPRPLPLRLPRVCVAITGSDGAEMVEKAEALARDNPFLEFRLDHVRQPGPALQRISRFLSIHPE